jgi:hypothetical protein
MINKFPEFKKLELSDKVEVENITRQYLPYSDYHFTQMWIWDNHEPSMLSKLDGNIVIRHSDALTGESFYSFLGSNCLNSTIKTIFDFLNDANIPKILRWMPQEIAEKSDQCLYSITEDRGNNDYILDVAQLFNASGKAYRDYRHLLNRYEKSCSHFEVRPLDLTDSHAHNQVNALFLEISKNIRPDKVVGDLSFEHKALNKLLNFANSSESLFSIGIYDDVKLIAFIVIDIINDHYAICPFLITNKNIPGLFQFVLKKAIDFLHSKSINYLNFEPDFGIESWRFYKMSYSPSCFLKKYTIEPGS